MVADPNQTKNIATEKPEVAAKLAEAGSKWHAEVFGQPYSPMPADGKKKGGKGKGGGGAAKPADDRPYPVGYVEFPITMLPARDGLPHGGVKRSSGAPNCSYFVNWTSKDDFMTWDIDVHTAGDYEVTMDYVCPEADAGSTIELSLGGSKTTGKVTPGWYPRLLDDQDRASRGSESYMRDFKSLSLGTLKLPAGRGVLTLKALDIPAKTVAEVRRVTLTLKK
jgi:hypothetical protein